MLNAAQVLERLKALGSEQNPAKQRYKADIAHEKCVVYDPRSPGRDGLPAPVEVRAPELERYTRKGFWVSREPAPPPSAVSDEPSAPPAPPPSPPNRSTDATVATVSTRPTKRDSKGYIVDWLAAHDVIAVADEHTKADLLAMVDEVEAD